MCYSNELLDDILPGKLFLVSSKNYFRSNSGSSRQVLTFLMPVASYYARNVSCAGTVCMRSAVVITHNINTHYM